MRTIQWQARPERRVAQEHWGVRCPWCQRHWTFAAAKAAQRWHRKHEPGCFQAWHAQRHADEEPHV